MVQDDAGADSSLHTVAYSFLAIATLAAALAAPLPNIPVSDGLDHPNRAGKNQTRNIPTSARFPP